MDPPAEDFCLGACAGELRFPRRRGRRPGRRGRGGGARRRRGPRRGRGRRPRRVRAVGGVGLVSGLDDHELAIEFQQFEPLEDFLLQGDEHELSPLGGEVVADRGEHVHVFGGDGPTEVQPQGDVALPRSAHDSPHLLGEPGQFGVFDEELGHRRGLLGGGSELLVAAPAPLRIRDGLGLRSLLGGELLAAFGHRRVDVVVDLQPVAVQRSEAPAGLRGDPAEAQRAVAAVEDFLDLSQRLEGAVAEFREAAEVEDHVVQAAVDELLDLRREAGHPVRSGFEYDELPDPRNEEGPFAGGEEGFFLWPWGAVHHGAVHHELSLGGFQGSPSSRGLRPLVRPPLLHAAKVAVPPQVASIRALGDNPGRGRIPRVSEIVSVVLGTAGHIDHGKSTLVRRLTGVDPDRLKEEKDRELTIDLGFAPYRLPDGRTVGIVDVPGHERFVKNMVAGATGIDLVLLVIAADDGVMPQTREHLEILTLLGLEHGLVVITKAEAAGVDDELIEVLKLELDELLLGTFLEGAPVCVVDSLSGRGLPELEARIAAAVERVPPRPVEGAFRMPIQRVFSSRGFGTVVTGIPLQGALAVGDRVEVVTAAQTFTGRVRGLQAYGQKVERVRAGHSSALNLADVDFKRVRRGDVACAPKLFTASALYEVRLSHLPSQQRPLRSRETVRFHVGTSEVLGEVVLLEHKVLEPGQTGLAQVRLRQPLVAVAGDRFVIRRHSPMVTLGGGVVLGRSRWRLKPFKGFVIERLGSREAVLGKTREALLLELDQAEAPLRCDDLVQTLHRPRAELEELLAELAEEGLAREVSGGKGNRVYVSSAGFERARAAVCEALGAFHREHPFLDGCDRLELRRRTRLPDGLLAAVLEALVGDGEVAERPPGYALSGHQVRLDEAGEGLRAALLELYAERAYSTPTREQALAEVRPEDLDPDAAQDIFRCLLDRGELVAVGDELVFHRDRYEEAKELLRASIEAEGPLSAGRFKEKLDSSRRYVIPLLEHFDAIGLTRREGDVRVLRQA
ncbi:MAG: selenocysteine-specific translation elongation factor [Planctomycetota bacterium]|nr:MAG: selenocysteine-specific translation elongation factor [Planctomycetota bacterium]